MRGAAAGLGVGIHTSTGAGEDLWHAYNLIREGDQVTATTFRKIQRDAGTGSESERVKIKLTISVEGIDYDSQGKVQGGK